MSGQPTKLTPENQAIILDAVAEGMYYQEACQMVGITPKTLSNWKKWGEEGTEPYLQFFLAIKETELQGKLKRIKQVTAASEKNWQAAMTWLERKYPREWGKFDRLGISPDDGEHEYTATSEEIGRRVRGMVEKALAGDTTPGNGKSRLPDEVP